MKKKDRVFLMDTPLMPSGLFGDAFDSIIDRYQEARKQAAAFQRFLPRRSIVLGAAGWEQPQPCTSSSYREIQKQSVASHDPRSGTEVDNVLKSRGLLRWSPIWGSCFSLGSPQRSGPDIHRITQCPSLLSALWRSSCQPCQSSRAHRSPASGCH